MAAKTFILTTSFAVLLQAYAGCSKPAPESASAVEDAGLKDLTSDASFILRTLPHVANVPRHGPERKPSHRIIHICNWHLVSRDDYLADLQSQSDEPLTKDEMDRYQAQLVDEVSVLQVQQVQLLTELIERHAVKQVYIEGFCIGHESSFERIIGEWAETERRLVELKADVTDFGDDERAKPLAKAIRGIERELSLEKAHYGAAAQLWHAGTLEKVLPCEDESLLDAAKPIADDGTYRENAAAIEAREDFWFPL